MLPQPLLITQKGVAVGEFPRAMPLEASRLVVADEALVFDLRERVRLGLVEQLERAKRARERDPGRHLGRRLLGARGAATP